MVTQGADEPGDVQAQKRESGVGTLLRIQGLSQATARWLSGWRRYVFIFSIDASAIALSFFLGFLIRFEGRVPAEYQREFFVFLPLLLVVRLPIHALLGIHRWSFQFSGLHEAGRVVLTCAAGSGAFITSAYLIIHAGPPRSIFVLELLLTTVFLGALRFSPRYAHQWLLTQLRSRTGTRVQTIIVGAGNAGELLLRDLTRSDAHPYEVIGFVDDRPGKWHSHIGGRPVLGPLAALPELVRMRGVEQLFFAIGNLPAARLREVLTSCAGLKLSYKILPVSYDYLKDHVPLTMLHQLEPEDLLHRRAVVFDKREMQQLIAGRRVLVTGAGGSIGGEICRQLAAHAPARIVLADINENTLYLLYRQLEQAYPAVEFHPAVVDIRDADRVMRLGREHGVQDVFHAAAHKHVPLMELAPEEAIKNNVTGCRNVAEMAHTVGAERFILISTDKAVAPSSVMGASKRLAELIVRDYAARSRTRFTAVRFGNVLGSAGSVVPLFKQQIAAGGPVTVTHADCTRYIMTISEAVGLVILAGLGGYGDLCILEMGEPIRILDLARLMITLSGQVPDQDIPITFIGLRPGEKLEERLMTEEEQQRSRNSARESIRIVDMPQPDEAVLKLIADLESLAARNERAPVQQRLKQGALTGAPAMGRPS